MSTDPTAPRRRPGATVTPRVDGPLILRGDFEIVAGSGEVIAPGRRTVALCRCGRSALKPFCDGSHRAATFRASDGDERPEPEVAPPAGDWLPE